MAGLEQIKKSIKMGHRAAYGMGIEKEYIIRQNFPMLLNCALLTNF
ncbi:MAG: hypothetical protein LUE96_05530 [Lachnospiraceae bacterium]|nr:hypothetical protein [Lachnospiraceae bacterium]